MGSCSQLSTDQRYHKKRKMKIIGLVILLLTLLIRQNSCQDLDSIKTFFNDNKGDVFSFLGIEEGKDINLTNILGKLNIDSQTVTDLTNYFKDNADIDQFVQSFKNPPQLRELLENAGIDAEEINKFVRNFEQEEYHSGGGGVSLAFGLIVASFVIFQM